MVETELRVGHFSHEKCIIYFLHTLSMVDGRCASKSLVGFAALITACALATSCRMPFFGLVTLSHGTMGPWDLFR